MADIIDIGVTMFRQTSMGMDQNLEDCSMCFIFIYHIYHIFIYIYIYIYITYMSHIWRDGHPFTGYLMLSRCERKGARVERPPYR